MSTFFSGTDTSTLLEEGSDMHHFVSLIVNNAGKYTAGITRHPKVRQTIKEEYTYPTWGDNDIEGTREYKLEREFIEWYNLDIEIEGANNTFEDEMLSRIQEIRRTKKESAKVPPVSSPYNYDYHNFNSLKTPISLSGNKVPAGSVNLSFSRDNSKQGSLFNTHDYEDDWNIDYSKIRISEDIIDWVVKQTITCSVIIPNSSNIDITKWANSMDSLYSKRFSDKKEFESFASNFVDFIINYTEDPAASTIYDATEIGAGLAYNVIEKLKTLPKNQWLDTWISMYEDYVL